MIFHYRAQSERMKILCRHHFLCMLQLMVSQKLNALPEKQYYFVEGLIQFQDTPNKVDLSFFKVLKPVEDIRHLAFILRHYACFQGIEPSTQHRERFLDESIPPHEREENDHRSEIVSHIMERLQKLI